MSITGAIVVFAVSWFLVFLMVLPIRFKSQGEAGAVEPGTPSSAPSEARLGRKALITTVFAVVISGIILGVIWSGRIGIDDLDVFHIMDMAPGSPAP
jgi:predicted secreted protein